MLQKQLMPLIKITFQNVNNKHYDTKIYKKETIMMEQTLIKWQNTDNIYIMIDS